MITTSNPRQAPADAAVVIQTILRPSLLRAARSVFGQDFGGTIHLLIGIDVHDGDPAVLDAIRAECPSHVMLSVFDPGYSTSIRHGGVHGNGFGGALRTCLGFAANSRWVAYLDDNDWYAPMHLGLLRAAIEGRAWAFSQRWLIDPDTLWPICVDEWDSVGPDKGINRETFGGFAHPSTLMLDQLACQSVLPLWSQAAFADGSGEDRLVFQALRTQFAWRGSDAPTCFCTLNARSIGDPHHADQFIRRGLHWVRDRSLLAMIVDRLTQARCAEDPARIISFCREVLAIHPYHADALRLLGDGQRALGHEDEAMQSHAQADLLDFAR